MQKYATLILMLCVSNKHQDIKLKKRNKIILSIIGVLVLLIMFFGEQIEDGLACLAYYDQCTAKRINGLTKEQCLNREDVVAFLYTGNVCLVKSTE